MTNQVLKRSELTKAIYDALSGSMLLGRGVAPPSGGWSGGQAGAGTFVPYAVLKTGQATTPAPGEAERMGALRTSWLATYQFTYHERMESAVDDYADVCRDLILSELPMAYTLDGVDWVVQAVQIPRMGATEVDQSTNPAHWRLTDDVSLHLSRARAR